jgi:hypothetical protein
MLDGIINLQKYLTTTKHKTRTFRNHMASQNVPFCKNALETRQYRETDVLFVL